jgi:hypothetical protein
MRKRNKPLLDDLKEKRRYWKLKEETLDHTVWTTLLGRGNGRVIRQTTKRSRADVAVSLSVRSVNLRVSTKTDIVNRLGYSSLQRNSTILHYLV